MSDDLTTKGTKNTKEELREKLRELNARLDVVALEVKQYRKHTGRYL